MTKPHRTVQDRQHEPPFSSPRGPSWTELPSPSSCGRQHTVSAPGEAHSSLGDQGVYWDLVRSAWLTTCVPDLSLSRSRCQGPHQKSHYEHRLPGVTQGPQVNKILFPGKKFQAWQVTSQLPGESRAFLWARLTFSWKILFCLELHVSESRNTINVPILLFRSICLAQERKCLPLRPLDPDTCWERTH